MARQPRLDLPGIPQHVVQCGNNRQPCFLEEGDRYRWLRILGEALQDTGCLLHAQVRMDNHAHLLMTPPTTGSVARLMQKPGRSYASQFNARHQRTGTLWEGRYKACLVDSENHVLRCQRYIDLNPLRARITRNPAACPWSSCAALCGRRTDAMLAPHPTCAALGDCRSTRAAAYARLLREALADDDLAAIRTHLQQQRAPGHPLFQTMVEARTRRFVGVRPAHRPTRAASHSGK